MPALVGKAALLNSILSCGMFLIVSNLAAAMCLIGPQICLWYYLSNGHTLDISVYVTQYYFDSNAVFTFLIALLVSTLADKPFYSLIHLKQDTKSADDDVYNSIAQFKASSVWNSKGGSTYLGQSQSMRYVEVPQGTIRKTDASNQSMHAFRNMNSNDLDRRETARLLIRSENSDT